MPNTLQIAGHALGAAGATPADAIRPFAAAGLDAAELIWQDEYRPGDLPAPLEGFRRGAERLREPYRRATDHAPSEEHA